MAYISIGHAPTRELFEQVTDQLGMETDPPAGLVVQTAAETGDGVQIVSIWESREAMAAFEQERLFPVLSGAGHVPKSQPESFEAFRLVRGAA
jgi:hypothetical protein